MNPQLMTRWRDKLALLYRCPARIPVKTRFIFGLFLVAAVCLAIHTSLTTKDAGLHVKLQHDFRNVQVSVWVDDELAYRGQNHRFYTEEIRVDSHRRGPGQSVANITSAGWPAPYSTSN